jgi:hypothetical protein
MFRDRDLLLLGGGALLSVFCLLLPVPFAGKLVAGAFTLVGFMVLALLRLGPDRIPPEEWLHRRLRFRLSPRRFVYHRPGWKLPPRQKMPLHPTETPTAGQIRLSLSGHPRGNRFSLAMALPPGGIYPLASVLLAVLGVYFIAWLAQGGAEEIAAIFR